MTDPQTPGELDGAARLSPSSPSDGASVDFQTVHAEELKRLAWRRQRVLLDGEHSVEPDAGKSPAANAHRMKPFGLAFSGGGIRSATFNLGILQGLAEHDLLRRVDYLSTVSGGGYIGSWLHGFIKHHCASDMVEATCRLSPTRKPVEGPAMEDPIAFLRKYSNYLAPAPGLFSADTWVIGAIWLRNVLLNQLILVPALAVPMLLALMLVLGERWLPRTGWEGDAYHVAITAVVVVGLFLAACGAAINLRPIVRRTLGIDDGPRDESTPLKRLNAWFWTSERLQRSLESAIVPLLFVVSIVVGCTDFGHPDVERLLEEHPWLWRAMFVGLVSLPYFILAFGGGFVKHYAALHKEAPWLIRRVSWIRASTRVPTWLRRGVPDLEAAWLTFIRPQWVAAIFILVLALIAAVLSSLLLFELLQAARDWQPWNRVALMPVLVHVVVEAGIIVFIGLMGADYPDGAREWVARIGTRLNLASAVWLALFAIAVWGPWLIASGLADYGKTTATALLAWVATTGLGVTAGRSAQSRVDESQTSQSMAGRALSLVIAVAPTVFMAGYLLLISFAVHALVDWRLDIPRTVVEQTTAPDSRLTIGVTVPEAATPIEVSVNRTGAPTALDRWLDGVKAYAAGYFDLFTKFTPAQAGNERGETANRFWILAALVALCAGLAWLAARRININEFSLHHFYKNRLVRCYLGASHGSTRRPNLVTGFDPSDDFPVSHLQADFPQPAAASVANTSAVAVSTNGSPAPALKRGECDYPGPYPIINTTLNINVGIELAQQERKSTSFVFTPEYCGFETWKTPARHRRSTDIFDDGGYRKTWGEMHGYSAPDGPSIGQAMAISGAAANPNSGYATTNAMAFLLTVFDARLGWWLGNPRWRLASRKPGPSFALGSLLSELFAQTNARSKYVNLSDGGHFDNLGLYELVRRRCRYIIIGDGEQDGELTFGSLGGAIRKCRADFGVEIAIDPTPIRLQANGRSKVHCVIGTITYPELDEEKPAPMTQQNGDSPLSTVKAATGRARGWILYLKSSLTGNEPADVLEYQARNPVFPHQSTGDQFFSESQFESYRRLGLHVVREALESITPKVGDVNRWTTPPASVLAAGKASVEADKQMMRTCRETSPFTATKIDLTRVFQKLTTKWYPAIPLSDEAASRLNTEYGAMVKRLGEQKLTPLLPDMLADRGGSWPGNQPDSEPFVFMVEQLGLMENVFTEFGFEHAANRANPRNRGWMKVFRQWAKSRQFYEGVWPRVKESYNPVFQEFVKQLHEEDIDDVPTQN